MLKLQPNIIERKLKNFLKTEALLAAARVKQQKLEMENIEMERLKT